ncbi:DUF364 domain-containing protein [Thalassolituus sp.]|jgi:uncharacterized protein (DUF4213/DUF364 family)|uniref:DUF364 domain-containing protein n=1 Tax=Thalassolituus sp. TaxID=2030822 RepID=UPI002A826194|nr:DUF364 domain-containing protein [Thalassolituus sp.]|tara:strand:- start:11026 stop:11811 length:786 start_codon:yes stop_codon:yes gene_type:complete
MTPERYSAVYSLIEQRAQSRAKITDALLGLSWSSIQVNHPDAAQPLQTSSGLCFSPSEAPRNISWSGSLCEKLANDVLPWLHQWNDSEVVVALATANAVISHNNKSLKNSQLIVNDAPANLCVFEHFAPQLSGANVAIIGRYPGLERYKSQFNYTCIERRPSGDDLPAAAANFVLPKADWVFITASSLANKSLPQLLWLARDAQVVLMGPSLPWLEDWADFGVNYLCGVAVNNYPLLHQIVAQGGGTRIFDQAVSYRLLTL